MVRLTGNDESRTTEGETVLAWCCWCWANFAKRTVFSITHVEAYTIQHLSKSIENFKDFKKFQGSTCTILYHLVPSCTSGTFRGILRWSGESEGERPTERPTERTERADRQLTRWWENWESWGENLYEMSQKCRTCHRKFMEMCSILVGIGLESVNSKTNFESIYFKIKAEITQGFIMAKHQQPHCQF